MALRELLVEFGVKVDDKPLTAASARVDAIGASVSKLPGIFGAALGALGLSVFKDQIDSLAAENTELAKAATKAGVGFEEFQAIQHTTGLSSDQLTTVFRKLQQNIAAAGGAADTAASAFEDIDGGIGRVQSTKQAGENFKALGIDVKDAGWTASNNAEKFERVADALRDVKDPAQRSALAVKTLGRSGQDLLPFLNKSPEEIHRLAAEFDAVGGITEEQSAKLKAYTSANKSLNLVLKSIRVELITTLVPAISAGARAFATAFGWVRQHLDIGRLLVVILGAVALKFAAAGTSGSSAALKAIGAWGKAAAPLIVFLLVLEDIVAFLQGDTNTALSKVLQLLFGESEGTSMALQAAADFDTLLKKIDAAQGLLAKFDVVNNAVWDNVENFIGTKLPEAWDFFWEDMNRLFLTGQHGFFGILTAFGTAVLEQIYATLRELPGGDTLANVSGLTDSIKKRRAAQSQAIQDNQNRASDLALPVSRPEGSNIQFSSDGGKTFSDAGAGTSGSTMTLAPVEISAPKPNNVTQSNQVVTNVYVADIGTGKDIGGAVGSAANDALIKSLEHLNASIPTKAPK